MVLRPCGVSTRSLCGDPYWSLPPPLFSPGACAFPATAPPPPSLPIYLFIVPVCRESLKKNYFPKFKVTGWHPRTSSFSKSGAPYHHGRNPCGNSHPTLNPQYGKRVRTVENGVRQRVSKQFPSFAEARTTRGDRQNVPCRHALAAPCSLKTVSPIF
jgi:hypothetical protein